MTANTSALSMALWALLVSAACDAPAPHHDMGGSDTDDPAGLTRLTWPAPELRGDGPQHVEIHEGQLRVNGAPFFVRGAGYQELMPSVVARGGNAVRTWGEAVARDTLKEAHELGLLVALGLWVVQPRQGFDYGDAALVEAQLEQHRRAIDLYKDDPALLVWGLGNEVNMPLDDGNAADPRAWDSIEKLAAYAHEVDPNHPTMSVVTDITPELIALVKERAPSLDILGINSYEGLPSLPERLAAAGWDKPYIVSEWLGIGAWSAPTTHWSAVVEPSSGDKADAIVTLHRTFAGDMRCLGGYVFAWGNIAAPTSTWFSLFDGAARPTELLDAVQHAWTGKWPNDRAPHLRALHIGDQLSAEPTGKTFRATVDAMDPEGKALQYEWELRADSVVLPAGVGLIPALLATQTTSTPEVTFEVPPRAGTYRLYATAIDERGQVGVANAPFLVEAPKNPAPAIAKGQRFHLGDFYDGLVDDAATLRSEAVTSVWDGGSQISTSRTDVAEGHIAQRATTGATGWLGFGVAYDEPIDVRGWTTLVVSLRASDAALEPVLSIVIADEGQVALKQGASLLARDYGFRSDGAWHELVIPLADFQAKVPVSLQKLSLGFGVSAAQASEGATVDIDGLYLGVP
jgi:hypothetical protein